MSLRKEFSFSNFVISANSFTNSLVMLANLFKSSSYESRSIVLQFDTFVSPYDMKQCGDGDELVVTISSMNEPT